MLQAPGNSKKLFTLILDYYPFMHIVDFSHFYVHNLGVIKLLGGYSYVGHDTASFFFVLPIG